MATAELEASIALLADLDHDWTRPTDCAGWTVHDLTTYLVGQYQGLVKPGVFLRRHRRAHRRYLALSRLDADNRQHIDDLGGYSGRELVAMLAATGPKAIRARRRLPAVAGNAGRMYPEERLSDDRLSYVLTCSGCATHDAPGRPGPRHRPAAGARRPRPRGRRPGHRRARPGLGGARRCCWS